MEAGRVHKTITRKLSCNEMASKARKRTRIFIVDDHPLVREWLTHLVNQQPDLTVCGEAGTAAEALSAIALANAHVAIVDISLRDSSGIELIKELKRIQPSLPVLVLSMHEESHYAERALRAGAKGYIMKREATRKIIEAVRHVLNGRFYLSEELAQIITTHFIEGKPHPATSPVDQLSDRELAVFNLLGRGLGTRKIADHLRLNIKTVQAYCARIKRKIQVNSAAQLVFEAVRHYESPNSAMPKGRK